MFIVEMFEQIQSNDFDPPAVVDGLLLAAKIWAAAKDEPYSLRGFMHIQAVGHMGETSLMVFEVRF